MFETVAFHSSLSKELSKRLQLKQKKALALALNTEAIVIPYNLPLYPVLTYSGGGGLFEVGTQRSTKFTLLGSIFTRAVRKKIRNKSKE